MTTATENTNNNSQNPEIQAKPQGFKLSPEQIAERQASAQQQPQQAAPQPVQTQQKDNATVTLDTTDQQYQDQVLKGQQQVQKPQGVAPPTPQGDVQQGTVDPNTDTIAKDNQGNTNVSRGIIGLNFGITEGTVADNVNPPSRFPNAEGRINPLTEQDLQNRIELERSKAGMDLERQRQIAIKIRTEMQNEEYSPPEEFKDDPELAPTPKAFQEKEPVADQQQGEQILNLDQNQAEQQLQTDNNNQQGQGQQQQPVQMTNEQTPQPEPQMPEENQQENIKG